MIPILTKLLYDNESLFEYERNKSLKYSTPFARIKARLIAMERLENPMQNDAFYDGMGEMYLNKYQTLAQFLYQMPQKIAQKMLCIKNGAVFIRKEKLEAWMDVIAFIPPAFLIAAFLLDKFRTSILSSKKSLIDFIDAYASQFVHTAQPIAYMPELNYLLEESNGLNDLHIHLNGSTESDAIWQYMIHNPYKTLKDFMEVYTNKAAVRKLTEQTIANFTPDTLLERLKMARKLRSVILYKIAVNNQFVSLDIDNRIPDFEVENLIGSTDLHFKLPPVLDEIIFYLATFHELENKNDNHLASWFHQYLLIKGIVHRLTVMQKLQTGFPQFQLITENSFRYGIETFYTQRFLQLGGGGPLCYLNLIEGRFSPAESSYRNHLLTSRIVRGFKDAQRKSKFLANAELVLIAHFIKKRDTEKNLPIRHRLLRQELKKKAMALTVFIKKGTEAGKLIKGIDAAASEFDAGPDVFAHAFRFLRMKGIEKCTYHAGEDFRHMLTGIRNIYEAMIFLELQTCDRIGHCTAIGISPELWMKRIGPVCIMGQGEWLDDLVFAWYIIKQTKCLELQQTVIQIENEIAEYSHKVYGYYYPPYILAEAWKMRKYNPFLYLEQDFVSPTDDWYRTESMKEEKDIRDRLKECPDVKKIWAAYHRIDNLNYEGHKNMYDELIEIRIDEIFNSKEIYLLQNLVLTELATKGIVIEALPTSNIRISYYKQLNEYHLSRWMNNMEEEVMLPPVVLGTDDPGIFTTNIYNEYAKAYLNIEKKIVSSTDRLQTISGLHKNSIIYNFKSHD